MHVLLALFVSLVLLVAAAKKKKKVKNVMLVSGTQQNLSNLFLQISMVRTTLIFVGIKYQNNVENELKITSHIILCQKKVLQHLTFYETGPRYEDVKNVELTLEQMTFGHNLSIQPQISMYTVGQRTIQENVTQMMLISRQML